MHIAKGLCSLDSEKILIFPRLFRRGNNFMRGKWSKFDTTKGKIYKKLSLQGVKDEDIISIV